LRECVAGRVRRDCLRDLSGWRLAASERRGLRQELVTAMRGLALSALLLAACSSGPPAATASPAPSQAPSVAVSAAPTLPSPPTEPTTAADGLPRSFTRVAFDAGTHDGTVTTDEALQLGPSPANGGYVDPYGGTISDERGTWRPAGGGARGAAARHVTSWGATRPAATWIGVVMRASGAWRQTKWYARASWSAGEETIHRTTVKGRGHGDGRVNVDTF